VAYPSEIERHRLERFPEQIAVGDLRACFALSDADRELVFAQRGVASRLGLAVQLRGCASSGSCPTTSPACRARRWSSSLAKSTRPPTSCCWSTAHSQGRASITSRACASISASARGYSPVPRGMSPSDRRAHDQKRSRRALQRSIGLVDDAHNARHGGTRGDVRRVSPIHATQRRRPVMASSCAWATYSLRGCLRTLCSSSANS
jgi:hypothetical protein